MGRQKHIKTEYEKLREAHRKVSKRHVLTLEAVIEEDDKRHIFALANRLRIAGNELTGILEKRYEQLMRTKQYRALGLEYGVIREQQKKLEREIEPEAKEADLSENAKASVKMKKQEIQQLEQERLRIQKEMDAMLASYQLTFSDARKAMEPIAKKYALNSIFALTRTESIWSGVERILYQNGKKLRYRKRGDLPVIRAKQSNRGISLREKDGALQLRMKGVPPFFVRMSKEDLWLQEEIKQVLAFLKEPETEEWYLSAYQRTGKSQDTFRPCYAALKCETIRGRLRVFVQITLEGSPFPKKKKDGTPRHILGKGLVGVKIGTQTMAVVSQDRVLLQTLAQRSTASIVEKERKEALLRRQMQRSLHTTNPQNYEADGTLRKGKKQWDYSKNYRRLRYRYEELARHNAKSREYAIRETANQVRSLGDCLVTNTRYRKTKNPETETKGKSITMSLKKSRFNRCPRQMHTELKKKFGTGPGHYREVKESFPVEKYDYGTDSYRNRKWKEAWIRFPDGRKVEVQRNLYIAFLMYCVDESGEKPDRKKWERQLDRFLEKENVVVRMRE